LVLASGSASGVIAERHLPRSLDQNWLALRQQLGIPADALVIGFVGRFVRDKGISELVAAFQVIRKRHLQCCLLLIGTFETGDPLDLAVVQYLKAALANSVQSGVYGTGWVADVAPYYAVMDVLALPTYREGFPISPLEASMCEVPVVGTLATGMVDAVVNGKTGLLVPIGDVTALTNALLELLENVELRQQLGAAGRQRALASFLPNQIWQAWCDYYL
jgi:glycosyltransferase involved in cell wall biosynthesis